MEWRVHYKESCYARSHREIQHELDTKNAVNDRANRETASTGIATSVATRRRRDRERRYIHRWTREIEARKRAERDAETREGRGEGVPEEVLLENERGPGRGEAS